MATPEVINVTAPADPCGYVFAQENKAAGGTYLEWSHYYLCQAQNALASGPAHVWAWFKDEVAAAWSWLKNLWATGAHGFSAAAASLWSSVQGLFARVMTALSGPAKILSYVLVGVLAVGAILVVDWATG